MRSLLFFLMLLFLFSCNNDEIYGGKCEEFEGLELGCYEDLIYDPVPDNYTGRIKFCQKGRVIRTCQYKNGLIHGMDRTWFQNGNLKDEMTWVCGKGVGKMRTWYPSGQLETETNENFNNGNGELTFFHEDGSFRAKNTFKNGKVVGCEGECD